MTVLLVHLSTKLFSDAVLLQGLQGFIVALDQDFPVHIAEVFHDRCVILNILFWSIQLEDRCQAALSW